MISKKAPAAIALAQNTVRVYIRIKVGTLGNILDCLEGDLCR